MRSCVLAAAFLAAVPLSAATSYRVTIEAAGTQSKGNASSVSATVLTEGDNRRVDLDTFERNQAGGLLTNDGGKTVMALNPRRKTWWIRNGAAIVPRSSLLAPPNGVRNARVRDLQVTASDEPTDESFGGFGTRKYMVRVTFAINADIDGAPVIASEGLTIFQWVTDKIDRSATVPAIELATGFPSIDEELAVKLAEVPGFALKTTVIATRVLEGTKPQVETITATVDEVRSTAAPPRAFERPADYAQQRP